MNNWVERLAEFAKKLLKLQEQVEKNSEEIKTIRQDLNALTEFTRKVAYAVRSDRERQEADHKILVLQLQNELLKLENRLSTGRVTQLDSSQDAKLLPDSNGKGN